MLEYDDVMNEQRRVVYKYRREILEGRDMSDVARERARAGWSSGMVEKYTPGEVFEDWDLDGLEAQREQIWPLGVDARPSSTPQTLEPRGDHRAC